MSDDLELLRGYAEQRDESAFAELVRRHVNLVHSAALRQVNGDAHLAADVTQLVFTDLARKASALKTHRVLAGWLFTSTRFAAAKIVRAERRRRARELEAHLMQQSHQDPHAALDWSQLRPQIDAALSDLSETDRAAILLRFFEGRDFAAIGDRLSLNANTARMRVDRALDKLHVLLSRRGVTSTSAALAAILGSHAVAAAPAGLAATVTGGALAGAGTGAAIVTFMSITKLQLGLAGAFAAAGTTAFVLQAQDRSNLDQERAALVAENAALASARQENVERRRIAAQVADMRRNDADLNSLTSEATALRARMERVAKEEAVARTAAMTAIFDVRSVDRVPTPQFQARPVYPAELRQAGITGEVIVDFVVDSKGAVQNAFARQTKLVDEATNSTSVVKMEAFTVAGEGATPPPVAGTSQPAQEKLAAAAVEAVSKWRFAAGSKGGRDVNTRMQVPIVFSISRK